MLEHPAPKEERAPIPSLRGLQQGYWEHWEHWDAACPGFVSLGHSRLWENHPGSLRSLGLHPLMGRALSHGIFHPQSPGSAEPQKKGNENKSQRVKGLFVRCDRAGSGAGAAWGLPAGLYQPHLPLSCHCQPSSGPTNARLIPPPSKS